MKFDDDSDTISDGDTRTAKVTSKLKENMLSSIEMKFDDVEEEAKTLEKYRQMKYNISTHLFNLSYVSIVSTTRDLNRNYGPNRRNPIQRQRMMISISLLRRMRAEEADLETQRKRSILEAL